LTVEFSATIFEAVMDALGAHQTMSKRAQDSAGANVCPKSIVLGPARLCNGLRGADTIPEVIG